jgi:hypothetical protein
MLDGRLLQCPTYPATYGLLEICHEQQFSCCRFWGTERRASSRNLAALRTNW